MGKQDVHVDLLYDAGTGIGWQPAPVYARDAITIVRGQGDESGDPTPGTAELTLDNRTGVYNPRNVASPLYGAIGRNTPIRIGVRLAADAFGRTVSNGWGTADSGQAWTPSWSPNLYAVTGGKGSIGQEVGALQSIVRGGDLVDVEQVSDVETSAVSLGASLVVGHLARRTPAGDCYWMRCEFDAGGAVTLKLSCWVGGTLTELASATTTLTYTANTPLRVRSSVVGSRLAFKVWRAANPEPADWMLTAVNTALTGPGQTGIMTWLVSGNTNSPTPIARFDNYQAIDRRFVGEVASWAPSRSIEFDPATGRGDAWTEITAAGVLRRLNQGADPVASALRHALPQTNPAAYWPLEDSPGALAAQSAVAGVPDMQPYGYSRFSSPGSGGQPEPAAGLPVFGGGTGIPGSAPVPDFAQGGVLVGYPPIPSSGAQSWRVAFVAVFPRDRGANGSVFIGWSVTSGTYTDWEIQADPTSLYLSASEPVGRTIGYATGTATVNLFDGLPHYIEVAARTVAGALDARIYIDGWEYGTVHTVNAPNLNYPPGWVRSITPNVKEWSASDANIGGMPQIGHIAVWQPVTAISGHVEAMRGHRGELAAVRHLRLCVEQDVPAAVVGDPADSQPVGAQRIDTLTNLLGETARTNDGIVYEPRDRPGLVLRTGRSLLSQPARLVVDYAAGRLAPPLSTVVDDQGVRNDVTAKSSTTGTTARSVLTTGRMSTQKPPTGVGRYTTEVTVNPATDAALPDHAGWHRHKGTVDELRMPAVTVDLVASPELTATATAVDIGDRVDVVALPDDVSGDDVALLVRGYTETIGDSTRTITYVGTPASPYQVAVADGDRRAAADGTTLAAPLAAEQVPAGTRWTFATTTEGWSALAGTGTVAHNGTGAITLTPSGTTTSSEARAPNVGGVTPGETWRAQALVTSTVSRSVSIGLIWRDAGGALLSVVSTAWPVAADVETTLHVADTAPANTAQCMVIVNMGGSPPISHVVTIASAEVQVTRPCQILSTATNGPWTTNPANFPLSIRVGDEHVIASAITGTGLTQTVALAARGVNGLVRAWPAGTPVDVMYPAIAPL